MHAKAQGGPHDALSSLSPAASDRGGRANLARVNPLSAARALLPFWLPSSRSSRSPSASPPAGSPRASSTPFAYRRVLAARDAHWTERARLAWPARKWTSLAAVAIPAVLGALVAHLGGPSRSSGRGTAGLLAGAAALAGFALGMWPVARRLHGPAIGGPARFLASSVSLLLVRAPHVVVAAPSRRSCLRASPATAARRPPFSRSGPSSCSRPRSAAASPSGRLLGLVRDGRRPPPPRRRVRRRPRGRRAAGRLRPRVPRPRRVRDPAPADPRLLGLRARAPRRRRARGCRGPRDGPSHREPLRHVPARVGPPLLHAPHGRTVSRRGRRADGVLRRPLLPSRARRGRGVLAPDRPRDGSAGGRTRGGARGGKASTRAPSRRCTRPRSCPPYSEAKRDAPRPLGPHGGRRALRRPGRSPRRPRAERRAGSRSSLACALVFVAAEAERPRAVARSPAGARSPPWR